MNYRELAQILGAQGRYGDTELVHVTPREKRMLRESGGSGTTNPFTGLDEYFESGMMDTSSGTTDSSAGAFGPATDSSIDVGPGGYATGPNVGTGVPADIGPDVEVGTHPFGTELDVAPAVPIENTAPASGFGGFFSNLATNFGKTGPSLSRDGLSAVPATVAMGMVPGGIAMRGAGALAMTIADALGISHESPSGLFGAPAESTGVGGPSAGYSFTGEGLGSPAAPPSSSMAIPSQSTAPQGYKGLEPYMRDYLRRQGIFV